MALSDTQIPKLFKSIVDNECKLFNEARSITVRNSIPDTNDIPIEKPNHWLKIPDVICVFVDMRNSTKLSAGTHEKSTAGVYRLFTETAVQLLHSFEAEYIDIKGDGVFALFNRGQEHRALAAAVTIRTFVSEEFVPRVRKKTNLHVGGRYGIDQKTVLVRRLGLKRHNNRTDRQNEVWAGKPVNMAAKLSTMSEDNELYASARFRKNLSALEAIRSCGCKSVKTARVDSEEERSFLWSELDVSGDDRFDFDTAYRLDSHWCSTHGAEYCQRLLQADST